MLNIQNLQNEKCFNIANQTLFFSGQQENKDLETIQTGPQKKVNKTFQKNQRRSLKKMRRLKRKANFNKSFSFLRERLSLVNCSRKFQFDSLLKKVKSKIFKTIYDSLKSCLWENFRLQRLPQTFITDIKIDSNKFYLNKSVQEIYEEFGFILSVQKLLEQDYIKKDKLELIEEFLNLSFVEVYHLYMESKQYLKDINKIVRKEGEKFGELFKYIAKNFLDYYLLSKGNKPKTKPQKNPKHLFRVIHKKKSKGKKEF